MDRRTKYLAKKLTERTGNRRTRLAREASKSTWVWFWVVLGLWAFSKTDFFSSYPFCYHLLGGKHLENNIHHPGDSNVTSVLCLEQRLRALLRPVSCCMVRAAKLVYTDRLHQGAHTLAWRGVLGDIWPETFDLFITCILEGTGGSPACVLASSAVCVYSLQAQKV